MRLLTRVSVLLLAVALVPLLRFIDLDNCSSPSAAPFLVEGLSDDTSPGIVSDRKDNLRFVTRVRAASVSARPDGRDDDRQHNRVAIVPDIGWSGSAVSSVERSFAAAVLAHASAPRGTPNARGPPA